MIQHLPRSTLFPYTTLFRSTHFHGGPRSTSRAHAAHPDLAGRFAHRARTLHGERAGRLVGADPTSAAESRRSEEHTSELQSQFHLVCRLLLEKKKNVTRIRDKETRQRMFIVLLNTTI